MPGDRRMSGISADGIDAVLTGITGNSLDSRGRETAILFLPFPAELHERIIRVAGGLGARRQIKQIYENKYRM